jgi:hypothetical protein
MVVRRCSRCEQVKVLQEFGDQSRPGICSDCRKAYYRALRRAGRIKPKEKEKERLRRKAEREASPERHRAAVRRWYAKMMADPEKHAAYLESARMGRRLRREREGVPLDRQRKAKATMLRDTPRYLPSGPLVALLDRIVADRRAVARVTGDYSEATHDVVAKQLGVEPRTVRGWRSGTYPTVRVGKAEQVLLRAGVSWQEVYSYDDHAYIFQAEPRQRAAGA